MTVEEAIKETEEVIAYRNAGAFRGMPGEGEDPFDYWAVVLNALRAQHAAEKKQPPRYAERVRIFDDPRTGRLFTTCSCCRGKVGPHDKFCKHCGREFWDDRQTVGEGAR